MSHFFYIGYEKKEKHRILSVCLSKSEAKKKIKQYQKIKGFSSHLDGFYIVKTEINQIGWVDGYRTGYFSMELGIHEEKEEE